MQVVARYSLPSIIDTLRINIATSWNLVVVAELVAAEVGLGKRIQLAQRFFRTDQIFAELIVLGLIGFAIDMGFRLLLRACRAWTVETSYTLAVSAPWPSPVASSLAPYSAGRGSTN